MKKAMAMLSIIVASTCLSSLLIIGVVGELHTIQHPPKVDGYLSLLVVGDWGRRGTYNQSLVALQMGIIGERLEVDFIISTGDNFYEDGLTDANDPAFDDSFVNIYTSPSLHKQWYTVLGNHDYRGDVLAQLNPSLTERDSRWLCIRSYIVNSEVADFFFIDTTPFQNKYFDEPKEHKYDWRGVLPRQKYISNLLKDLEFALEKSNAKWKMVIGHHPIKSAGHHGNSEELVAQLLPILQAEDVDLYINGHDHCLQHISSPDGRLQFLTSGGGSKAWEGDISWWSPKEMKFYHDGQGFMSIQITRDELNVIFYDISGNALHQWTTSTTLFSVY